MSRPPEIIPTPVTDAEKLEDSITRSLRGIRDRWPYMWGHYVHRGQRIGGGSRSAGILPGKESPTGERANGSLWWAEDDDPSDGDVPAIDRIASLRREVVETLKPLAREVVEERHIEKVITRWGGRQHPVNGRDALDLIAFLLPHAQWIATMSGDPEWTADELRRIAARVKAVTEPAKRESMNLGHCPLEIPGDEDVLTPCRGTVRATVRETDRDGEAYAECDQCGERAVWTWWERRMYPDPELRVTLTAPEVVTFLHRAYGVSIQPSTVRQWVKRRRLDPSGTDETGRSVFAREAVIYAYETWRQGTRLLNA